MEKSNQPTSNETRKGYWILLLAVVAGVLAAYVPFLLVIAPALWAYAGVRTKPYWILSPSLRLHMARSRLKRLRSTALTAGALIVALLIEHVVNAWILQLGHGIDPLRRIFLMLYGAICLPELLSGNEAYAAIQSQIGISARSTVRRNHSCRSTG
ncbi:MAG: hypothetical protein R2881_05755 [Eubacteriales bacterium]